MIKIYIYMLNPFFKENDIDVVKKLFNSFKCVKHFIRSQQ